MSAELTRRVGDEVKGRSLWADANSIWRPLFCAGSNKNGVSNYAACGKFQVSPNFMTTFT